MTMGGGTREELEAGKERRDMWGKNWLKITAVGTTGTAARGRTSQMKKDKKKITKEYRLGAERHTPAFMEVMFPGQFSERAHGLAPETRHETKFGCLFPLPL